MDCLDNYFVLQKYRIGIGVISLQRLLKKEYSIKFLEILTKYTHQNDQDDEILLPLYKDSFSLLQNETELDFEKIEKTLFSNLDLIDDNDKNLFFSNGLNFLLRKFNRGNNHSGKIALRWYKLGIENNILIKNNHLSKIAFQNIVLLSSQLKEFEWCRKFIDEYQSYLKPMIKDDCVSYNLAIWHFYQKQFDETVKILSKEKWIKDYQLSTKNLLNRTLFEQFLIFPDYYQTLEDSLYAFELFILRNKKFPKKRLQPHLNMIRLLSKLAKKINKGVAKSEIKIWLNRQLDTKKVIIFKSWFRNLI